METCSQHHDLLESLNTIKDCMTKIKIDGAVAKTSMQNLETQINVLFKKIDERTALESLWKRTIVGTCITLLIAIVGTAFGYGSMNDKVLQNQKKLEKQTQKIERLLYSSK